MGWLQRASQAVRERIGDKGGRQVPLAATEAPNDPRTQNGQGWFGPGQAPDPAAPPEVAGRRMDFIPGVNMLQQPRQYEAIGFDDLRALADNYDIMRLIIETRKDQLSRMTWSFGPIDVDKDVTTEQQKRIDNYTKLFRRPDREQFWGDWIRSVLEDLLVIDAPAIHVRRTLGGDIYSLDQIDGATIKRVVDEYGRTPEPPFCAYQQVLKGMNAVNYSKQDLVYRPRNMRVHKLYGYSPVEQVIMTVNIALRRQMWQLAYFTDGNIPDSLIGVPSTWTPDQIKQFQDWFDGLLQGNLNGRRSARFVPGEVAKSYVPTKEAEMFGHAEEWLAKVVCFCFGISAQPFEKMMNRATAETAVEQAKADGMAPIMNWIKGLHDAILIDYFGEEEIEFKWNDDKELDPKQQADIHKEQLGCIKTINEIRDDLGLEPDDSPEADMLGSFCVATGQFVPLNQDAQIEQKKKNIDAFTGMGLNPDGSVPQQNPPPEEGENDNGNGDGKNPPPKGGKKKDKGSAQSGGSSAGGEGGSGASAHGAKLSSASLVKGKLPPASPLRPKARRIRKALQKRIAAVLREIGDDVASQVERLLEQHGVEKAAGEDNQAILDAVMAAISLGELDALIDATYDDLLRMAEDTGMAVLAQLGASKNEDLVNRVNARAVEYARERSAELVGKRVLEDGTIIDNPDPKWAITETTRNMIRDTISGGLNDGIGRQAIVDQLQDSYAFSSARAEMVSRTEISMANSDANMTALDAASESGIQLLKEWILGPDPCEICQENAGDGQIELDAAFSSGDDTTPAHPNCECSVVGIVVADDGSETETGEE